MEGGSDIFLEGEDWWLTELEQGRQPEPQLELADDNFVDDDLTFDSLEAALAIGESDSEGHESMPTGEGLPLIPGMCQYAHIC